MKAIVTGGAGFIGSNLAEALAKKGDEVKIIDNFSTGNRENLNDLPKTIEVVEGTVTDIEFLRKNFVDSDCVFHLAAIPSVPRSVVDPLSSHQANVDGTINVLEAARLCGVNRVIYSSSSSAYGDSPLLPKREDMTPSPLSPYAVSKLTGEYYCKVYNMIYGIKTLSLRYFNIFGPKQDPNSRYAAVLPKFISAIMSDIPPSVYGDGTQSRDFTYVQNVINANILASNANICGEVINIACGERINLLQLIEKINALLGKNIIPKFLELRKGDVKNSLADISKAKKIIGYSPSVYFDDGLKNTIEWFRRRYC